MESRYAGAWQATRRLTAMEPILNLYRSTLQAVCSGGALDVDEPRDAYIKKESGSGVEASSAAGL